MPSCHLVLPVFEGPLDVLLRLIERDQLAVSEVSLLAVFDQFMAFTRALGDTPPHVIAEFAAVAGRLSVLKSRALLPRPPQQAEEPDEFDLVRQLEDYRALKAAAELLAGRHRAGAGAFGRGEGVAGPIVVPAPLAPQEPSALARAVARWLSRVPARPELLIARTVVSLREMIARIASAVDRDRKVDFDAIRATCAGRHDVAVAFLAVLTLLRRQAIVASQPTLFGSITLQRSASGAESKSGRHLHSLGPTNGSRQHDLR